MIAVLTFINPGRTARVPADRLVRRVEAAGMGLGLRGGRLGLREFRALHR